jgi:hypothetical protein
MRWTIALLVGLVVLPIALTCGAYYWMFPGYCGRLESRARDPEIQRALESWVDVHWTGDRIPPESIELADGIAPGFRWLTAEFDGSLLSMGADAHARLLGVGPRNILDDAIAPEVDALYFAERSRYGIAVRLRDRDSFGLPAEGLIPVTDRIGLVCLED